MSTRRRESAAPGKEKRGTSPSHIGTGKGGATTTQLRRSPIPSKTNSPDGRNIPSYLKPTASSANDASKQQGKKPVDSSANKQPTLARRRSFDNKPPSPSRSTKSPVSPNPTLRSSSFSLKTSSDNANKPALLRRRSLDKPPSPSRTQKSPVSPNPNLRSSSFSGRTGTSQKGVSDRNLKGPKDAGKQHTLYARPVSTVKKSSVFAKKHEPGSGSSRKERVASPPEKAENPNIHDVLEPEPQSDDQESLIAEEQTILVGNYNEKEPEDSLLECQEVTDIIEQTEGESDDKDAVIVSIESPTVLEEHDANIVMVESPIILENQDDNIVTVEPSTVLEQEDASLGVNTEEVEDESQVDEEISNQQEDIEEHTTTEMNDIDTDESVAGNPDEEVEDKETEQEDKEEEEEEEEEDDDDDEAIALNTKEEVDSGNESHKEKEEQVDVDEKNEEEDATPRVAHGKKDLALSNDVIEETANKLIEQRKNKVKALAGAFETVMSLQEPK